MSDDRQAFEMSKPAFAKKMAEDRDLQETNKKLHTLADKHNYSYLWNWMGVPIIQCPSDIMTMQELIWERQPDVIIETGVARGGSLVMYASILSLIGKGKVIGVDIDLRPHNRASIEQSRVSEYITLIEGSSVDEATVDQVKSHFTPKEKVMVVLDSNHTHEHVFAELSLYAPLVTKGQSLVVTDTCIDYLPESATRKDRAWGKGNSPKSAKDLYMQTSDRFELDAFINQRLLLTSSPNGYYLCTKEAAYR